MLGQGELRLEIGSSLVARELRLSGFVKFGEHLRSGALEIGELECMRRRLGAGLSLGGLFRGFACAHRPDREEGAHGRFSRALSHAVLGAHE